MNNPITHLKSGDFKVEKTQKSIERAKHTLSKIKNLDVIIDQVGKEENI